MTLLALLLVQVTAGSPPVLGAIGPQSLPVTGCAAFLWQTDPGPVLIAMAGPTGLRLSVGGKRVDLAQAARRGEEVLGLPTGADYAGDAILATVELTITADKALVGGARVPAGTLTVAWPGGDATVVPVAGLVGCAAPR